MPATRDNAPAPSAYTLSDDPEALLRREEKASQSRREEGAEDDLISLEHVEGRMRRSVARQVIALIRAHPDRALAVIRAWIRD